MKIINFHFEKIRATFWFVPSILVFISILLSTSLVFIDGCIDLSDNSLLRFFLVTSSDSARIILSTISGAMIGVAGTVFSVTLVALTLASSQFGPRLISNFMYVRLNQIVLGSYISTYLYCLLVLNAIKDNDGFVFIPSISILFAIIAAMVNIILLIVFIHKIAMSIQADNVIADISDIISEKILGLNPGNIVDEELIDIPFQISRYNKSTVINCVENGYLQLINYDTLLELTTDHKGILELYCMEGDFLVKGKKVGLIYSNEQLDQAEIDKFNRQMVIGKSKTSQQDLEFSIHQIVEIAARSLSPGVNDPFTAIACINNLTSTMVNLTQINFPSKYLFDEEEKVRLITKKLEFKRLLDVAFNQIRQYSEGSPSVIIRLMEALITIHEFTKIESDKQAVIMHAEMVLRMGKRTINEEYDLNVLVNISRAILN